MKVVVKFKKVTRDYNKGFTEEVEVKIPKRKPPETIQWVSRKRKGEKDY